MLAIEKYFQKTIFYKQTQVELSPTKKSKEDIDFNGKKRYFYTFESCSVLSAPCLCCTVASTANTQNQKYFEVLLKSKVKFLTFRVLKYTWASQRVLLLCCKITWCAFIWFLTLHNFPYHMTSGKFLECINYAFSLTFAG